MHIKKVVGIVAILLLAALVLAGAGAADSSGTCGDGLTWSVDENKHLTITYDGVGTGVMDDYENFNTPWGDSITAVFLPDGLKNIGSYSFHACRNLVDITIPESVTTIGDGAFWGCCYIEGDIAIPSNVNSIGSWAFVGCSNVKNFTVSPNNPNFKDIDGVLFSKDGSKLIFYPVGKNVESYVFPDGLKTIGNAAFYMVQNITGDLDIPSSVTTIEDSAFSCCGGLNGSLKLSDSLVSIGDDSFGDCGFTGSLVIPSSVTTIGPYAFHDCSGLISVIVPSSLTTIEKGAFNELHLNSVIYAECSESLLSGKYSTDKTAIAKDNGDNSFTFTADTTSFPSGFPLNDDNAPVKDGYTFDGWYANSAYTGEKITTVTNGQTLYAKWTGSGIVDSGTCGDNLTWVLTENGTLTISGYGSMYDYEYQGAPWYQYSSQMTKLVLPDGLTTIGDNAFCWCSCFTGSLVIPDSVTTIGDYAFYNCSGFTGSLVIPDSVTTIGDCAFYYCIGFTGSLVIPDSVTTIGDCVFWECGGFTGPLVLPDGLTSIGSFEFSGCHGFTGSLDLPDGLTTIANYAFYNCSGLISVIVPSSLTTIEQGAFNDLHLNSVIYAECSESLLSGKYSVDKTALAKDNGDNSFTFTVDGTSFATGFPLNDDNAPVKDGYTFDGWYANSAYTGEKVTTVTNGQTLYAKWTGSGIVDSGSCGDNLTWVLTDDGTLTISGTGAMYDYGSGGAPWYQYRSQMTKLVLPDGLTTIGNGTFSYCSGFTGSLTIPSNVTTIGKFAFEDCSGFTGSLTIPSNVTTIGKFAFSGCSGFTGTLTIPSNVTTIGELAFQSCHGLTGTLTIPSSVINIGDCAFSLLTKIENIFVDENNPNYKDVDGILFSKDGTSLICAPAGKEVDSYSIPLGVTTIGDSAFYYCTGFTGNLTIPSSVTTIGDYAFAYSDFTGNLTIPSNVTTIGSRAFSGCSGFTGNLTIPSSVTTIGDYAFEGCHGLTGTLTIPSSVINIGDCAFSLLTKIENIFVDENNPNYKDVDGILFTKDGTKLMNCPAGKVVDSYVFPSSVTTIGNSAFSGCSGFTGSLEIPNSVTTIGSRAFSGCSGFTSNLTIPSSVMTIQEFAFSDCSGLTSINVPSSVTTIGGQVFINLHSNSVIYAECSESLLSDEYSTDKTALAKDNGDNSYTFTVDTTSFPSGFSLTDDNAPVKDGQIFNGWYANSSYTGEKVTTVTNGQTLCAKWTPITYTVKFDGNGSTSGSMSDQQFTYDVEQKLTKNAYEKTGHTFAGWSTSASGSIVYTDEQSVKNLSSIAGANVTLYAKWAENEKYTVTYSGNGNTSGTAPSDSNQYHSGDEVTVLDNTGSLIRTNYTFSGWNTRADGQGTDYAAGATFNMGSANVTLYAKWTGSGIVDSGTCGDNLTWVLTEDGTLTISGNGAMYDYELQGAPWYQYSSQMTKLVLQDGLTTIGDSAFVGCRGFTGSLTIPSSVTTIGDSAFGGCSGFTGSLVIPNSVTKISSEAFCGCSGFTGSLVIPENVTTIENLAFSGCSGFTGSLVIPKNVKTIGTCAFDFCIGFTGLVIPESVTTIGGSAFGGCRGFTGSLVIPESVTTIGDGAFYDCRGFTGSLVIPESVTTIGDGAFHGCNGLTDIIVNSENPNYSSDSQGILYNKDKTTLHTCPAGKTGSFITIPPSVTTIGDSAFYGCSGFTGSLVIPEGVTTIGDSAFYDCSGFTGSLTIPSSVTTIESYAFCGCSGLISVIVPSSLTTIEQGAFNALHLNSVIYAECSESLLSGKYSVGETALAKDNGDNSFTFTVDATSFSLGFSLTDSNAPVKDGYTFDGWYANSAYTGEKVTTVTNGQTLYAKWTPITYTVKFDGNGSTSGSMSDQQFTYGEAHKLTKNTYEKTGHTFAGWSTSASGSAVYTDEESVKNLSSTAGATVTLYAKWTENDKYTVTYSGNGNTGGTAPSDSNQYYTGDEVTVLDNTGSLVKTNYTFSGWNTRADGQGTDYAAGATFNMGSANVTLYAKWTPITYTVKFDADGGSPTPQSQSVKYGEKATKPAEDPTKTGYTFAGWFNSDTAWNFTTDIVTSDLTLTAHWTPVTYKVAFDGNGSTSGSMSDQQFTYDVEQKLTKNTFTRTGYTFAGWSTSASGSVAYTDEQSVKNLATSGTVNLYAVWTKNTYTVTFDADGGSPTPQSQTVNYGNKATKPAEDPTKTGYTFAGWFNGDTAWNFTTDIVTSNLTLTAHWTANTYKVHFNAGSGSGEQMADQSFTYDVEQNLTKNTFTRTGYTFAGWAKTATGSVAYTDEESVKNLATSGTVNLYAVWTENTYTVTFDAKGGSPTPQSQTVNYGNKATKPAEDPTKTGYTFAGWFNSDDAWNFTTDIVTSNLTLTAHWTPVTYKVAFDGNGSTSGTMSDQSFTYDVEQMLTKNAYEKTCHTFAGWSTSASGSVDYTDEQSVKNLSSTAGATVTLYAKWTPIPYTVTFDANGGSPTPQSQTVNYGNKATKPADPTKTGYTFAGWFNGDTAWNFTTDIVTSNLTLTAHWTANTYKVAFDGNGSTSGTMSDQQFTYDVEQKLTKNTYEKTGHTFAGWSTSASGSAVYTDEESVKNLSSTAGATVTLYAKWTENDKYTVTYSGNGNTGGAAPADSNQYYTGDEVIVLGNTGSLIRTNYTFSGWNTQADGQGTDYAVGATFNMGSANVTLYAKWTPITYTVTFDADGGSPTPQSQVVNYGEKATKPAEDPTKTGYTFAGWFNGDDAWNFTTDIVTSNLTLTAHWTPVTYKVAFDGNGSTSGSMSDQQFTYDVEQKLTKNTYEKTGHTFAGWSTSASGSAVYTDEESVKNLSSTAGATVTLYAKWTENEKYTVTYSGNGNTGGAAPADSNQYYTGDEVTVLDNTGSLIRTNYTFSGWNTQADGQGTDYAAGATFNMGSANVTLYAKWTENDKYTVTYSGNGNTGGAAPADSNQYHSGDEVTVLDNTGSLVKTNYTFSGWNTQADGQGTDYAAGATFNMGSANVTLYAKWTPITYTVTFDADGGSPTPQSQSVKYGEKATKPAEDPTKTGYTFAGWFNSDTAWNFTTDIVTSDLTLTAHWTPVTYKVAFDGNGSTSGSMSDQQFTYDVEQKLTKNTYEKTGHTFAGWSTSASGSAVYTDEESVKNLSSIAGAIVTLYAKWTESSVEISTTNITFTTQKEGYAVPDEKQVTITNNTASSTVTVSASSQNFTYSGLGSIPAGQSSVVHVQPVSGLSAGEYSDVISVRYTAGSSVVDKEVSVKFSVIKTPGKEEETVIPDLPEIAVKTDSTGKTVSVEASSSFVISSGTEPGNQTASIQKTTSNVKLEITKATVTVSGENTKVELSPQSTITAVYPETSADNKQKVTESTYSLDVGMETIDGNLPTISGEFNSNVSKKVEDLGYTAEYMISATNTDLTGINENVSTVTPRFTVSTDKLPADHSKVKIIHTSEDKSGAEYTEVLTPVFSEQGSGKTTVSATSTHGFSSYVLSYENTGGELVTSIIVNGSSEVYAGSQTTLTATVLPATATNKKLIWSSSDTSVATVDSTGKVTALKAGTVTITATASDGSGVSGSRNMTVLNKEYTVTFSGDSRGTVTAAADKSPITSGSRVSAGSSVVFTMTPDDGYRLKTFTVNGLDRTSKAVSGTYAIESLSENTSVAATFESIPVATYTVTFSTVHGTQPAAQYIAEGDTATDPGKLFESGYVFGGWYSDKACTVPYGFSTPVTGDLILYAKWTDGDFTVSTSNITFDARYIGGTVPGERVVTVTNLSDSVLVVSASSPDFKYSGLGEIPAEKSTEIRIQPASTSTIGEYSDTILIKFKNSLSTVEKTVSVNFSVVEEVPHKEEVIVKPEVPSIDTKTDDTSGKTTEVETASETVTTSGTVPGEQTATIQKDESSVKIEITNATVAVSEEETKVELTNNSTITAVYPETLAENKQEVQEAAYTLDVELETVDSYLPTVSGEFDTNVSKKIEDMGYTVEYMISTTNTDVSAINENVKSVTVSFIVANDKIPSDRSRVKIVHTSADNDPEEFTEILTPTFTKKDENTTIVSATSERGFSVYTFAMDAANMVASGGETTTTFFGRYQGDNTYQFERAVVVTELIVPDGFDRSQSVSYSHKETGMPDDGYYQFTLSAPGYNKGESGMLSFQILLGDLGVKGYETHDIVLKKGDAELPTWHLYDDGKYVYYLSEITDAGTYVISFVRGGSEELPIQNVSSEPGYLNIRSTPQHAAITINGVSYGETPQTGIELDPGTYAIKLELDWYNPYMDTVTITAGETLDFYQRLEQTDERKEAAKTPFPIIGVLAGLGVAGVLALRRR